MRNQGRSKHDAIDGCTGGVVTSKSGCVRCGVRNTQLHKPISSDFYHSTIGCDQL
jgi:hypothetical protein